MFFNSHPKLCYISVLKKKKLLSFYSLFYTCCTFVSKCKPKHDCLYTSICATYNRASHMVRFKYKSISCLGISGNRLSPCIKIEIRNALK